jgi:hypothetical protein
MRIAGYHDDMSARLGEAKRGPKADAGVRARDNRRSSFLARHNRLWHIPLPAFDTSLSLEMVIV